MNAIQKHHIVDIYVRVYDTLPKGTLKAGRKSILTDNELMTIILWDGIIEPHKNLYSAYMV